MILQRINLSLFAVLGELSATANWRAIAEKPGHMAGAAPGDRGVTGHT